MFLLQTKDHVGCVHKRLNTRIQMKRSRRSLWKNIYFLNTILQITT